MSFFRAGKKEKKKIYKIIKSTINNKEKSSLQTFNNRLTPRKRIIISSKKGQFYLPLSEASLTVETALILPIFLWVMCFVIYFSKIISIDTSINNAIYNAGRQLAVYSYAAGNPEEESDLTEIVQYGIGNGYVKHCLGKELDKNFFEYADIDGDLKGINLLLSEYDGDLIDITAYYYINLPFGLIGGENKIKMVSKCRMRKWTGYAYNSSSNENTDIYVYVTPTGKVYHMTPNCSHIELSLTKTDRSSVKNKTNIYGSKYYECSICKSNSKTVYITDTGDKYHSNEYCSGIKRMVFRIPISEVGNKKKCSRCGG